MFVNVFFIFLVLSLVNVIPDLRSTSWTMPSKEAFIWGIVTYFSLLGFLYLQVKCWAKKQASFFHSFFSLLVNVELMAFLIFYHFILGAQRLLNEGTTFQTPSSIFVLSLYFLGLSWAHLWNHYFIRHLSLRRAFHRALDHLLFLFPFCLPFLIFSLLFDLLDQFSLWHRWQQASDSVFDTLFPIGLGLVLLVSSLAFIPPLLVFFWKCKPLEEAQLRDRLEKVCAALRFKCAGMKIWTIMKASFTAGIIGVFPFSRYVMFTPALLSQFSAEEVEAILVHEIGHSRYKHLLIYPFILMGMILMGTALMDVLSPLLSAYFSKFALLPFEAEELLLILSLFLCYALLLGAYFRLVFGFFSRLFERQADLYIFEHSLSPSYLIQALDHLGVVTGYTHRDPSWHHFSIHERILFLQLAMASPQLIQKHHRKVKRWVYGYFGWLGLGAFFFFYFA